MAKDTKLLPDMNEQLIRHLQDNNEILRTSKLFASLETNEARVSFSYDLLRAYDCLPLLTPDGKSSEKSEEFRRKGNEMFKMRKDREAHEFYTKSVAFAEGQGEVLGLAYANRSAVLFEKGLYEECLKDIDLAFKNNYPERLTPKLIARQLKATELLPTQEKVEFFTPAPSIGVEDQNPLIQSAMSNIKIENSAALGRHVVATKDLAVGDIIAIEKPFCQVLNDQFDTHCHHCLNLCYNLLPCPNCTEALFCSDTCLTEANLAYHQYECVILLTIKRMDLWHRLVHLRVTLLARKHYESLEECAMVIDDDDGVYRSDRYNEIHNLVANTTSRNVADLFNRAMHAAAFYHLLKTYTSCFQNKTNKYQNAFKELVLLHMQTGPCNFHELAEVKSSYKAMEKEEIGAGAFSFLSMFNHSCCPNIVRYSYGTTVIAITIEPIKKGEQCFDNYGYHHAVMPKPDRKAKLKKQYFFDCTCTACINDYPLYDSLRLLNPNNIRYEITLRDLNMLEEHNLEEAKEICKKLCRNIEVLSELKPNKLLAEHQEALKQCYFIFQTIKTPL